LFLPSLLLTAIMRKFLCFLCRINLSDFVIFWPLV
jgi:hypothetical protein